MLQIIFSKGLVLRTYEKILTTHQQNNTQPSFFNPVFKWAKDILPKDANDHQVHKEIFNIIAY